MKFSLLIIMFLSFFSFSQKEKDTIIKNNVLTAISSNKYHATFYVYYILHKGGGICDRNTLNFVETKNFNNSKLYIKSGYDKGHLANAEDFAYDCEKEKQTFFYYNCIPQTPNLNRGIWKIWEDKVREYSQKEPLLVICGAKYSNLHTNKLNIPTNCFKIVISLFNNNHIVYILWFTNDLKNNTVVELKSLDELESKLGYKINLDQILKK